MGFKLFSDFKIKNGVLVKYRGKDSNVVIPDSVTSIGDRAFWYCASLQSITIPNSVIIINDYAFYGCTSLLWITIPSSATSIGVGICARCTQLKQINVDEGNPNYTSIDGNLYNKDGKTLIQYAIGKKDTSFTIPSSVTSIGGWAFYGCTSLTNITIPDSVTNIGGYAFYDCTSLTSVTISNLEVKVGIDSFINCPIEYAKVPDSILKNIPRRKLKEVVVLNGKTIERSEFSGCTFLKKITIPDSATSIGDFAFFNCVSLTSITIPNSVKSIGDCAFSGCKSLKTVYNLSKLKVKKGAETHGKVAYYADNVYTELPNPDFEIKDGVLVKYKGKGGNVVIPKSITSIGYRAFDGYKSLTSITITDSVVSIGDCAFYGCTSLQSITIPNSVTSIGEGICVLGNQLKQIIVEEGNANYISIDGNLYTKDGKTLVQYAIGKKDTSFIIPTTC